MRYLVIVVLSCALLGPAVATAKEPIGAAKVVFTPAPKGLKAGQAWNVRFRFYFAGGKPWRISGLKPWVTIRDVSTGRTRVFDVVQNDSTYYSTRIRFPAAGTWTVSFHFDPQVPAGPRKLTTLRVL